MLASRTLRANKARDAELILMLSERPLLGHFDMTESLLRDRP